MVIVSGPTPQSQAAPVVAKTPNTTYYVRGYAHNSAGYAYGSEVSFTTSPVGKGGNFLIMM